MLVLAELDPRISIMLVVGAIPAISGCYVAVYGVYRYLGKHLHNPKKHPCSDDIVFKDVCKANRDCIETKLDGMKELMEQRFDNLEELVRNNGQTRGRVRT